MSRRITRGNPSAASESEQHRKNITKVALSEEATLGRGVYDKACQACHNSGMRERPR